MAPTNLEKYERERQSQNSTIAFLQSKESSAVDNIDIDHYVNESRQLQSEVMDTFKKILGCVPEDVLPHQTEYHSMLSQISDLICSLRKKRKGAEGAAHSSSNPNPNSNSIPTPGSSYIQIRLPKVDLPHFNGNSNEWTSFRDLFNASVHTHAELCKAQKLSYLRSCLTGDAAKILGSMQCTDDNYDIAWDLLHKRYENECEIFFSILKRFSSQPNLNSESATGIRSLLDISQECIRALENIKVPVNHWDGILVFQLFQKLDPASRRYWELSRKDTSIPKLTDFFQFLDHQARALAAGGVFKSESKSIQKSNSDTVKKSNVHHVAGSKSPCKFCPEDHFSFKCPVFTAMSIEERRETLKKKNLCFNCLHEGHRTADCFSKKSCFKCKLRHHTMVHLETPNVSNSNPPTLIHHSNGVAGVNQTLLATALIQITDRYGNLQPCRALLDGGSNSSFISESCVKRLGLKRKRTTVDIVGVGASSLGTAKGMVSINIHPHFPQMNEIHHQVTTLIIPKVTGKLPPQRCNSNQWPHLQGLLLADPNYNKPSEVEILLGADIFWDLLLDGKKKSPKPGSPIALRSTLGWLVAGNLNSPSHQVTVHYAEAALDETLQKFWEVEGVPTSSLYTKEEKLFEEHFQSTTTRDETGRFVVKLPIKDSQSILGSSRDMAVRRLIQLEKRLERNVSHKLEYHKFMDEYENLGHMQLVSRDDVTHNSNPTYYIPHHFVLKESSTSTKFRVVFDASAKTSSGQSLNDKLMVGPTIQDTLFSILLRFRTHVIALTADIAKMYRQIRVSPPDTDLQRIVWRKDPNSSIQEYRLLTATYGTASAPFHATRVLQKLADEEKEDLPLASSVTRQDFYVDDLMSGAPNVKDALELTTQLLELMRRGGLELRKWSSNSALVLQSIPLELRETQVPLKIDVDDVIKALGLRWNPGLDEFNFKVQLPVSTPIITKRTLLSEMAKVFDPLGFLAPAVIRAKILFQQLWKLEIGWDESLPVHIQDQWLQYRGNLPLIEDLSIPRCIFPEGATQPTLHGFCDASEKAYAAVIYARVQLPFGQVQVSLVAAKTRVAPTKQISLPRLELCGAVLLSQLMESVQDSLKIKFEEVKAWTDSTIVLAWLRAQPTRWKTFVANRVAEIQETLPPENWNHVSGLENPADCASRGLDPSELFNHPLWWKGPRWLYDNEPHPHINPIPIDEEIVNSEERKTVQVNHVSCQNSHSSLIYNISSLRKVKAVTSWCLRFIHNCRVMISKKKGTPEVLQPRSGPLNAVELDYALLLWVKIVQNSEFPSEIQDIRKGNPVSSKSKLRNLNPFLDSSDILRVGGRLRHAPIATDQKIPILLPRHHRLTELLIQSEHQSNLHAGPQLLHSILHRRFWIIGAKDAIRHQIRKCVTCIRHRKSSVQQFMGDLPAFRVTPARAFLKVGIDYAGPFSIRSILPTSKSTFKAYLALFICLTTRAIHLELVSELSTAKFLLALKRFIARRGICSEIHSDCGTNFVGAARELKELHSLFTSESHTNQVSSFLSNRGIVWKFNPPGAPHFGGIWEAGVKSAKFHMYRVIGTTRLSFEELYTIMTQIEACLNSRPLTPMSSDPNDLVALTPGHFIIGDCLTSIPEPDITSEKLNRLTRFQLLQQMSQHFWRRWSGEFLTRLQQRPKWLNHRTNLEINDLVIVKDENLPPLKWKLGRVINTHPGPDGMVRVVTLKTAEGELKRPVVKLCLLPIDPSIESKEVKEG